MTTFDLLLLSGSWAVIALPAAIGVGRVDGWKSGPIVLALGPFAYFGFVLCRRHRDALVAETAERRYRA